MAATRPSIMSLGATRSAPARAWGRRRGRAAAASRRWRPRRPRRSAPQWPWSVYWHRHTSVAITRLGRGGADGAGRDLHGAVRIPGGRALGSFVAGRPNRITPPTPAAAARSASAVARSADRCGDARERGDGLAAALAGHDEHREDQTRRLETGLAHEIAQSLRPPESAGPDGSRTYLDPNGRPVLFAPCAESSRASARSLRTWRSRCSSSAACSATCTAASSGCTAATRASSRGASSGGPTRSHALRDPLLTDRIYAPEGFNLAWATVIPGPAAGGGADHAAGRADRGVQRPGAAGPAAERPGGVPVLPRGDRQGAAGAARRRRVRVLLVRPGGERQPPQPGARLLHPAGGAGRRAPRPRRRCPTTARRSASRRSSSCS